MSKTRAGARRSSNEVKKVEVATRQYHKGASRLNSFSTQVQNKVQVRIVKLGVAFGVVVDCKVQDKHAKDKDVRHESSRNEVERCETNM